MLLRVVLFGGMFLLWGATNSVYRAWRSDRSTELLQPDVSCSQVAYVVQIFSVYWFTVALKSGPQWWSEGSAVFYALSIGCLVMPMGMLLLDLPEGILKAATWGSPV